MANPNDLIDQYLAGPALLEKAVAGMAAVEIDAKPIPGKWSTRQVVCHIADFEPVYADRMKRVIAEDRPSYFAGDPDVFEAGLAYDQRDIAEELKLIRVVRSQMGRILHTLSSNDFQRIGIHSIDGPITLEETLRRITNHVPHHARFIEEKRRALRS